MNDLFIGKLSLATASKYLRLKYPIEYGNTFVLNSKFFTLADDDKVVQDIVRMILLPKGVNKYVPTFGSNMFSFIGKKMTVSTRANILSELLALLADYNKLKETDPSFDSSYRINEASDVKIETGGTGAISSITISFSLILDNGKYLAIQARI